MVRKLHRRMDRLRKRIDRTPIDFDVLLRAYEEFRQTGRLPTDDQLACKVLSWVRIGSAPLPEPNDPAEHAQQCAACVQTMLAMKPDPVMKGLWCEAGWAKEPVREAARLILEGHAARGEDPTQPLYANRGEVLEPSLGSMALAIIDYTNSFNETAYRRTAADFFARLEAMRERVDGTKEWFDEFCAALEVFGSSGMLPSDPLKVDAILLIAEYRAMLKAREGNVDPNLRRAVVASNRLEGKRRCAAIERLQGMVREGALA